MGYIKKLDIDRLLEDEKAGLMDVLNENLDKLKSKRFILGQVKAILEREGLDANSRIGKIPKNVMDVVLYGMNETVKVDLSFAQVKKTYKIDFDGLVPMLEEMFTNPENGRMKSLSRKLSIDEDCSSCHGYRLQPISLHFKIDGRHIGEVADLSLLDLKEWLKQLPSKLGQREKTIAEDILNELNLRLDFLLNIGLEYLSLSRSTRSLSGGEAQRIRLATQIGSELVNVLYILDEPSIGLHPRDNTQLINSLKALRDMGNSIIVVEHDKDMMLASDYIFDIGPLAGTKGGYIVWHGDPKKLGKAKTLTADYLRGDKLIAIPEKRRVKAEAYLELLGATGHNLKKLDLKLPLGCFIGIAGVSGSGKSSLINETLYPILSNHLYRSTTKPLPYGSIKGLEHIDKVIEIDQSPIGRSPRSNPATYTQVFGHVRDLFAQLNESKVRGYGPGRFSFNVKDGRCPECEGAGLRHIEMNFLPDVYVHCELCDGKRFNRETLEVRYKGKSIADVLAMTIDEAVSFFEAIPRIHGKLITLQEVGLGYLSLGQQATTLSGGEAQRVKLAAELSKKQTGKTFYILDEPTTGLHFEDINILMKVLHRFVALGNTVLIIEHNLDVLKQVDFLIELGPKGGHRGGQIVSMGTPEEVSKDKKSVTGPYLKEELIKV
ncbi:unnamed protein product [Cyprideis torosa]|uniref:Uncharacterized protein n=1 Tax=Cyprideis torosa TaxID=163714 RepID=A0A7R8ZVV2_9CRUS|nr:unnamed protein product [Cyprideis torosa]CAG0904161.1 unnamed protein product [Cyprideis torosa]